jgi:hypothetical protein
VLIGGRVVRCLKNQPAIVKYFQMNLAVVEVRHGENLEEAWRRYLADNPEANTAHVKIFHYAEPSLLK